MEVETMVFPQHTFAIPESSPHSLRQVSSPQTPPSMRHSEGPGSVFDEYVPSSHIINDSEEDYVTEDDLLIPEIPPSGRSSISSFPASIIHHNITPSQTFSYHGGHHKVPRSQNGTPTFHLNKPPSPLPTRDHITGFRNPSSVRALQMRDEFSDGEDYTPGHRRRGSRMSYVSYRSGSSYSTPGKRMSRSLQGSPIKNSSKLRKEFPLVLLHCSILPSIISPKMKVVNEELLEAIIPEPYKKRWKLLQEKVMRNFEVRERGVLIPHPRDDYDILEERLLESLELERSVINNGHFVGRSESRASTADSGFGSDENSTSEDMGHEEGEDSKCVDCGGQICGEKRWEVKVFAANGLMKAGAWGAAWSEMEKVDVQVSVWLPESVRQEIEARLDAVIAQEQQLQDEKRQEVENMQDDERTREIYGESPAPKRQEEIDGLTAPDILEQHHPPRESPVCEQSIPNRSMDKHDKVDLQVALARYIQLLLQDRRNIAILFLTMLLLFYGMSGHQEPQAKEVTFRPDVTSIQDTKIEYLTETIITTSTSIALETTTLTETIRPLISAEPSSANSVMAEEILNHELSSMTTSHTIESVVRISGEDPVASVLNPMPDLSDHETQEQPEPETLEENERSTENNQEDSEEIRDVSVEEDKSEDMVKDEL